MRCSFKVSYLGLHYICLHAWPYKIRTVDYNISTDYPVMACDIKKSKVYIQSDEHADIQEVLSKGPNFDNVFFFKF